MGVPVAKLVLDARYSELPRLERLIDGFPGLSERDRMRVRIAATELFDNIVAHARDSRSTRVSVRLLPGPPLRLELRYRSSNFAEFVAELAAARSIVPASAWAEAGRFEAYEGRYRGLGLIMCLAVASSLQARPGLFRHLVSVVF